MLSWKTLRPYLPRLIGLVVIAIIFYKLLRPICDHWNDIRPFLSQLRWDLLAIACLMFTVNQLICRFPVWHLILSGLGHPMPFRPMARVWASGELARYIPGMIWQVVGRATLARRYGLPMTTCSVSQVLELTIYLLANVIVAVSTLSLYTAELGDERARMALRFATFLIPALFILLHPKVFYPLVNGLLRKLKKPQIEQRLSFPRMIGLLLLAIAGQYWLGLAIWLATYAILHVPFHDVWLIPGAYCLAWSAGFCMGFMASAGIGIRELVLTGTLSWLLGTHMGLQLDAKAQTALFAAIALTLRLWATAGELVFVSLAVAFDWHGFRGLTQAPVAPDDLALSIDSQATAKAP